MCYAFSDPGPRAGSFYWCNASLPTIPDLSALPSFTLRDITDLFLGSLLSRAYALALALRCDVT